MALPFFSAMSSQLVCENTRYQVYFDHLQDGRGFQVENYLVVRPKGRATDGANGVAVLPVLETGEIVLVKAYRHPVSCWIWEAVRGFCENGETSFDAARREMREEAGLEAPPECFFDLGIVANAPGVLSSRSRLFIATKCRLIVKPQGELGLAGPETFTLGALVQMMKDGELLDCVTQMLVLRYLQQLQIESCHSR